MKQRPLVRKKGPETGAVRGKVAARGSVCLRSRFRKLAPVTGTSLGLLLASCTGELGSQSGPDPGPGTQAAGSETGTARLPLRRLNKLEYQNTFRDLLGVELTADQAFASQTFGASGYAEGAPMTPNELDRMLDVLDSVVGSYATTKFDTEMTCDAGATSEAACARTFAENFAARAYRHPPSEQEVADLVGVYEVARADHEYRDALLQIVKAALLSPRFHYRWELGDEKPVLVRGVIALSPYEVASRLSYFIWQSMPDAELFQAAERGDLSRLDKVAEQARRMLADPKRAGPGVRNLFASWLPLGKLYSAADAEQQRTYSAFLESSLLFVEDLVIGEGDRSFRTMLGADYAFVNDVVAPSYGLEDFAGADFKRVTLTDANRSGLFTQPAFLAATSDSTLATVIRRGKFITERLGSCREVPPLKGEIPAPPARDPEDSVREHLSAHTEGSCMGCHQYMDPAGFAFDQFDALGRVRTTDDYGKPVDASGVMLLDNDTELQFSGAADLLRQLGTSDTAQRCFAEQVARFALRAATDGGAKGSVAATGEAFVVEDGDIFELLIAATQSYAFYYRQPAPGEVIE